MRTFTIITEADARVLERGSTVSLAPGGHVTPLAQDTLRERRIVVVSAPVDTDTAAYAPVADVRRVAIGGDHTSVALKNALRDMLRSRGLAVTDVGTESADPVDYPDIAAQVARLVARAEADAGVVLDGAGLGSAIAANKIRGIRAAMCTSKTLARYAREHNGASRPRRPLASWTRSWVRQPPSHAICAGSGRFIASSRRNKGQGRRLKAKG
jgi:ribose 5-phosphate isomerase B